VRLCGFGGRRGLEVEKRAKLIQPIGIDVAVHPTAVLFTLHQARLPKDLQMMRDGRLSDPNFLGEFTEVAAIRGKLAVRLRLFLARNRLID